jgi:hypothetical protein
MGYLSKQWPMNNEKNSLFHSLLCMIIVVIIVTTFSVNIIGIGSSQSQVSMAQQPQSS